MATDWVPGWSLCPGPTDHTDLTRLREDAPPPGTKLLQLQHPRHSPRRQAALDPAENMWLQ